MNRVRRFRALPPLEQALLIQALVLLPLARVSLAAAGFGLTHRWLGVLSLVARGAPDAFENQRLCDAAARMVAAAARQAVCGASCLPRALVLWSLLRRRGLDPVLRFGVRHNSGLVEAHAWVQVGPVTWDDTGHLRAGFVPMQS